MGNKFGNMGTHAISLKPNFPLEKKKTTEQQKLACLKDGLTTLGHPLNKQKTNCIDIYKYINLPNLPEKEKYCIFLASEIACNEHFEPFVVELRERSVLKELAQDCYIKKPNHPNHVMNYWSVILNVSRNDQCWRHVIRVRLTHHFFLC